MTTADTFPVLDKSQDRITYTFVIDNFTKRHERKLYSDQFSLGGYNWRLLVFPHGNNVEELSLYLDVPDAKHLQPGWFRQATFRLSVINLKDPSKTFSRDASHRFNAEESDWGFTQFLKLPQIHDPCAGYLINDTITVQADVLVSREVHQHPYAAYLNYDSKKETGFVGLKNQGATCYMNSLLQTLFHTNEFRRAVYAMPTENENSANSIPLALQRVFYRLQTSSTSVGTKELTKSFGWDAYDSFTQHDVQELNRVLCDNLEEKMKSTKVEGAIGRLFGGELLSYIECINVNFKSTRKESFYDLSLNVKGCKDILASFDKYVEEETLDGDNKYLAEGHGLQDARKGVRFVRLPPVLHMQLKRFEYDPHRDTMVKVNDKYIFYQQLDLDKYLADDADRSVRNLYQLHSVLVHCGDVSGGHYYAFIKPSRTDPQWFKFDDERVTKVTEENALDDNYGGEEDMWTGGGLKRSQAVHHKRFSNAYMLVYVRGSEYDSIMAPIAQQDISPTLRARFDQEVAEEDLRKKERSEAHLYMSLKVAFLEDVAEHRGADLVQFSSLPTLKILKDKTLKDVRRMIGERRHVCPSCVRLWSVSDGRHLCKTFRPEVAFTPQELDIPLHQLLRNVSEFKLYAEINPHEGSSHPEEHPPPTLPFGDSSVLLFLKYFDPSVPSIEIVEAACVCRTTSCTVLAQAVIHAKNLPPATPLLVYEEVSAALVEPLNLHGSIQDHDLRHGDILCFQIPPEPNSKGPFRLAPEYYEYLLQRVDIQVRSVQRPKETHITLELSRRDSYDHVVQRIAEALKTHPLQIRVTATPTVDQGQRQQLHPKPPPQTLGDLLNSMPGSRPEGPHVLYYEKLDYSVHDLESKNLLKIPWYNLKAEEVKVVPVLVSKEGTVEDVIAALKDSVPLEVSGQIRLIHVSQHRITGVFATTDPLQHVPDTGLRAEEIPSDEVQGGPEDFLVPVSHFCPESNSLFSTPFLIRVSPCETSTSVKSRIRQKLGLSEDEVSRWRLCVLAGTHPHPLMLGPDEVVQNKVSSPGDILALEHPDTAHRPSKFVAERPVKIYN